MPHLDEGVLHALVDGEVPSTELGPIRAHLEACADCRARLDEARASAAAALALVDLIEVPARTGGAGSGMRRRSPARSWGRPLALAASLVLAVGLGYAGRGWLASRIEPARPTAVEARPTSGEVGADRAEPPAAQPATTEPGSARAQSVQPHAPTLTTGQTAGVLDSSREKAVPAEREADRGLRDDAATRPGEERAAEPAPPAPPVSALRRRSEEFRPGANALAAKAVAGAAAPATLAEAAALLDGRLRMIEGLVPLRLETARGRVLVIYPLDAGELVLEQWRSADTVAVRLRGPLTADSLASLLRKVR